MASPTDDKLQTIAVTAGVQNFTAGFAGTPYTAKNTGDSSIFYRQKDPAITFAGTAAVLKATPFFMAELKPGKLFYVEGATVAVVCATGKTSTLSVSPYQAGSDTTSDLQIERYLHIDLLDGADIANWDFVGVHADQEAIASSVVHIPHEDKTTSIEIDKSAATEAAGYIAKTIAVNAGDFMGPTLIEWAVKTTDWSNIAYVVLRLGTSSAHYAEWLIDPEAFSTTAWTRIASTLTEATQTGNGLDMSNITYLALGIQMDGVQATAAAIQFEEVRVISAPTGSLSAPISVEAGNVANTVRMA